MTKASFDTVAGLLLAVVGLSSVVPSYEAGAWVKPSRERIRFCHVISPLFMVLHWLVAIPVYLIAYGALFAGLGLLVGLGRLFLWLGDRLDRLGRA